jgi:ABC-2 type transport system permease protein
MLKFELKRLLSPRANQISLLVFLLSALLAIFLGANTYKNIRKDQVIATIVFDKERAHLKEKGNLPEMGSLAYYAKAPTQWQLSPWAALFTGQSQNNLAAMKINALALQGQIYNKEVINPNKHRAGGFDLGFVLAYMLPILIGVLSVNLLSDERQSGRFRLLSAFAGNAAKKTLIRALLLRFYIVSGLLVILFIVSATLLTLPLNGMFLSVVGLSIAYCALWFLIAGVIVSLNLTGLFNSLAFISIWLVFAVLTPGAIHLILNQQYTQQPALQASVEQRLILNDGWDQDMQAALTRFSEQYLQFSEKLNFEGRFHWKWYYAMHQLSDLAVDEHWQAHLALQQARDTSLSRISWLSPNLVYQQALNTFSGTDTLDFQQYLLI